MLSRKPTNKEPSGASVFPFRLLVWGTVLCILVPLTLLLAVHLPPFQEQLIGKLVREIERSTPLEIRLGSYRLWPFSRLELLDLRISSSGRELLSCDQARLEYRFTSTWPYVHARELLLEKAVLNLERDAQGNWLLPGNHGAGNGVFSKPVHPEWIRMPLPQVKIVSGTVTILQNGRPVLTLRNVNGTLSFRVVEGKDGPRLQIELGGLSGEKNLGGQEGKEVPVPAEIKPSPLSYMTIDGSNRVAAKGLVSLVPGGEVDVEIRLDPISRSLFPLVAEERVGIEQMSGYVRVHSQAGQWTIDHDLTTNIGAVKGTVVLLPAGSEEGDPPAGTVHWWGRFENVCLPVVFENGGSSLSGNLEIKARGRDFRDMKVEVKGELDPSRWGDIQAGQGLFSGTYAKGAVFLEAADIRSSLGNFSASVWADVRGAWDSEHAGYAGVSLKIDRGYLDKLVPGLERHVGGALKAEGRYGPGKFRAWKEWQATLDGNLNIPDFLAVKLSGSLREDLLQIDYELEAPEINKVSGFIQPWEGRGRVSSRGNLKGTLQDLIWEGSVSSPRLEYGPVVMDQLSITGKGKILGREGPRRASLKVRSWSLLGNRMGAVQAEAEQQGASCRFEVKGEQIWEGTGAKLRGLVENLWLPTRTLVLKSSQVSWRDQVGVLDARIDFSKEQVQVHSLTIQQNRQKLQLAGILRMDSKTDLTLVFDSVSVGAWLRFFGKLPVEEGSLGGQVRITGGLEQPGAAVNLQITNLALDPKVFQKTSAPGPAASGGITDRRDERGQAIEKIQLVGNLAGGVLQLQADLRTSGLQVPAVLNARIPLRFSLRPLHLEVKKTEEWSSTLKVVGFSADRILPYVDVLSKVEGRIDGEVQGGGTLSRPFFRGFGTIRDGDFTLKAWPNPVEKVRADWTLEGQMIHIRNADAQVLGGRVQLHGRLHVPSFRVEELESTGENLEVKELFGIHGWVSGKARLAEPSEQPELSAELKFSKAEMQLGGLETDLARDIQIVGGDETEMLVEVKTQDRKKADYFERMKMGLNLSLPDTGTWVRGKGLDVEISGSMRVEKASHGPVKLFGSFHTLRGTYNLQGNQLKVVEGELIFRGTPQPDPILKIVCQKQVKDVIIQVQVTGPVSQPKLALSSVPSMNRVDILSYLLFGHPALELNSKERFQLQDRAASWIGSQTSHVLKDVLGDKPWTPDTLHYRSSDDKKEGAVVEIGKYVTPDLYVTYGKGVRGETENQVQVEYRLNRRLSIQTQVGGADGSGVDVFWRHDFGN